MNGRALGVLGLALALVASSSAWHDYDLLREGCSLAYQSRRPCIPSVPRMREKFCRNFGCCWDPMAPSNTPNCYDQRDRNDDSLLIAHPALRGQSDIALLGPDPFQ